jgi:hypothetical protein
MSVFIAARNLYLLSCAAWADYRVKQYAVAIRGPHECETRDVRLSHEDIRRENFSKGKKPHYNELTETDDNDDYDYDGDDDDDDDDDYEDVQPTPNGPRKEIEKDRGQKGW